jgi:flagellar L-ring protein precursor FlgH
MTSRTARIAGLMLCSLTVADAVAADNLFRNAQRANVAADVKSLEPGGVLTVIVVQRAESRNVEANSARRDRSLGGSLSSDALNQTGELSLESDFSGQGETRRRESFVTQISVTVQDVSPNGDLFVEGEQRMKVNGENTLIRVRGRVRPEDISPDNQVLSTRLADAEIEYDGKGFVSRSARSGPLGWLFSWLGF